MKILLLYNARSGTNSIGEYFMKQNPHFTYINQPWSFYNDAEEGITPKSYSESIKSENLFIKNEISNLKHKGINKETLIKDFDKIILLARKNKREQAVSAYVAQYSLSFTDNSKKNYYVDGLNEEWITQRMEWFSQYEIEMMEYIPFGAKMFFYEDLFYDNQWNELFEFLNLEYNEEHFKSILDSKHRYKVGEVYSKKSKTLF
jgi:hypothetical protein